LSRSALRAKSMGLGIGLAFLVAAYGLTSPGGGTRNQSGPLRTTSHSSEPDGYLALYRWLQALQLPVTRWDQDFIRLPKEASVLLVAGPEMAPDRGEIPALQEWIRRGGTLVVAARPPSPFLDPFGLQPGRASPLDHGEVTPVLPGPYTREVLSVSFPSRGVPAFSSSRPTSVVHGSGPSGPVLVVTQWGRGRVIALVSPEVFSNQRLREGDHARLALNLLLHHLGEGALLVDEYHHGYGRISSVGQYLFRSALFAPLMQGALVALLVISLWGRRFGPPRPLVEGARGSSMDYVRAMGGVLRRANATGVALDCVVQWVREEARREHLEEDRGLQTAMEQAGKPDAGEGMTDRALISRARGLYWALNAARRRGRQV